jgi:hypothetical protein
VGVVGPSVATAAGVAAGAVVAGATGVSSAPPIDHPPPKAIPTNPAKAIQARRFMVPFLLVNKIDRVGPTPS